MKHTWSYCDETALADKIDEILSEGLIPVLVVDEFKKCSAALRATSQTSDAVCQRRPFEEDCDKCGHVGIGTCCATPSASSGPQAKAVREAIAEIIQPHSGGWHQRGTRSYFVPNCSDEARWKDALIKADAILALYAHPQPQQDIPMTNNNSEIIAEVEAKRAQTASHKSSPPKADDTP